MSRGKLVACASINVGNFSFNLTDSYADDAWHIFDKIASSKGLGSWVVAPYVQRCLPILSRSHGDIAYNKLVDSIMRKLHDKGITGYDKQDIESMNYLAATASVLHCVSIYIMRELSLFHKDECSSWSQASVSSMVFDALADNQDLQRYIVPFVCDNKINGLFCGTNVLEVADDMFKNRITIHGAKSNDLGPSKFWPPELSNNVSTLYWQNNDKSFDAFTIDAKRPSIKSKCNISVGALQ